MRQLPGRTKPINKSRQTIPSDLKHKLLLNWSVVNKSYGSFFELSHL